MLKAAWTNGLPEGTMAELHIGRLWELGHANPTSPTSPTSPISPTSPTRPASPTSPAKPTSTTYSSHLFPRIVFLPRIFPNYVWAMFHQDEVVCGTATWFPNFLQKRFERFAETRFREGLPRLADKQWVKILCASGYNFKRQLVGYVSTLF